ncbi:MAG: NADH-quinone oxidoreductase subunit K [Candidatus Omnitrophica bacterium]|nr:NADH-quinone oxidoreductase subunit K [Candidatus Omnitrophota bacterium]
MNLAGAQTFWYFYIAIMLLFVMGAYYIIASFNLIRVLIGLELLIKAVTLLSILTGYLTHNEGLAQALVITLIVIEVVIMVVAGGIVVCIYRNNKSLDTRKLKELKG